MNNLIGKGLFITVFTDASHCPDTKAAGWSVWIKYGNPVINKRWARPEKWVKNSNAAEILALKKAKAYLKDMDTAGKIITIQSDCTGALSAVDFDDIDCKYLKKKHVKAHSKEQGGRSKMNDWCDRTAKRMMWNQRVINREKQNV